MRDEQIERELDGVALNRRHALGALPVVAETGELGLEPRDVGLRRRFELAHRGACDVFGRMACARLSGESAADATRPSGP